MQPTSAWSSVRRSTCGKTWRSSRRKPLDEIRSARVIRCSSRLRETIRECDIPRAPFADLLTAFRQDQTVTRYPTFDDVLGYCKNSANPVGHLVLYLCGYRDAERQKLSDYTCTALQLANFWQDVAVDYGKGRIYLPLESLAKFGVSENDIAQRRATAAVPGDDEVRSRARSRVVPARTAAGQNGRQTSGSRHRAVQPRRAGDPERHRAARATTCCNGVRLSPSRASCGCWRERPWESCCERTPAAAAGRLRSLPAHRTLGSQELLLRLPGSPSAQAQCPVGRIRLHAPRRRYLRRPLDSVRAASRET